MVWKLGWLVNIIFLKLIEQIPDLLVENNISVATFSDNWGFKMEAYNGRTQGPIILAQAGVNVL